MCLFATEDDRPVKIHDCGSADCENSVDYVPPPSEPE